MKITANTLEFSIKVADDIKHPGLLAYASLKFIDEHGRHFTVNGFTIRKSKFDANPYLAPPSKSSGKGFYKFVLVEKSLWKEIEKEVVKKYENELIPIVEEGK